MSNNKILSIQDLDEMEQKLNQFQKEIVSASDKFDESYSKWINSSVVQSFYNSGTFGKQLCDKLEAMRKAIKDYSDSIYNEASLVPSTKKFISSQRQLLSRPAGGVGVAAGADVGFGEMININ